MPNSLGAKPKIDTSEFKNGIKQMDSDLRVLRTGFKATAATMVDWTKDATGLEARARSLGSQIEIQARKVAATRAEWERVKKVSGENSLAANKLEADLNNETASLNKMETELGQTSGKLEEVKRDSDNAAKGIDKLGDEEKETTRETITLKGALATLGSGVGVVVGGIVAMTKALALAAAAVAGLAIGAVAFTVGAASDLNETISKTQVVFGDAAEQVLAFGKDSAEALGLSENAALSAAGTYGNLLRAMGLSEEASADMSIELVKLAGDLASFNNLTPEEVLEKLRAGLTGEAEPLKQLGVNMNQARIAAKALELGLVELDVDQVKVIDLQNRLNKAMKEASQATQKYGEDSQDAKDANIDQLKIEKQLEEALAGKADDLTAAAKAQAAYAIIMEDTALAQGDFARTSDGLANQQRIVAANFENLRAKMGGAFLPIVNLLATKLNELFKSDEFNEFFEGLVDWLGEAATTLEPLIERIGLFIRQLLGGTDLFAVFEDGSTILENLFRAFGLGEGPARELALQIIKIKDALSDFINGTLIPFVTTHAEEIKAALIGIGVALAGAGIVGAILGIVTALSGVGGIIAAVLAIVGVFAAAWEGNWLGIRERFTEMWEGVLKPILQLLGDWLSVIIPAALRTLSNFWTNVLLPAIQRVWSFLNTTVFPLWRAMAEFLTAVFGLALRTLSGIWTEVLLPALRDVWEFLSNNVFPIFHDIGTYIAETFRPILDDLGHFISTTLVPAFGGISGAISGVIDWLLEMADILNNLTLPDWLTPGSPTPWEIGLIGINKAMQDLNRTLPVLAKGLNLQPQGAGGVGLGGSSVTNDSSYQFFAPVIIQGETTPGSLGAALKGKRY